MTKPTERQQQALDALDRHDGDRSAAADELGIPTASLRRLLSQAKKREATDADPAGVVTRRTNRYSPDGQLLGYSTGVALQHKQLTPDEVRRLIAEMEVPKVPATKPAPAVRKSDVLDMVLIGDMHLGMLAHHEETGTNWDTDISLRVHLEAVTALLSQGLGSSASIVAIGDILHANDQSNQTPKSRHQLDVDSRHYRTMRSALTLFSQMAAVGLRTHDTLDFQIIKGNHDPESAMYLGLALAALFSEEPRVRVPYDPSVYRFTRWGKTFIGHTHGDRASIKRMPLIYATEHPTDFAECVAGRHIYCGHIHSEKENEDRRVTVETLQTLAPQDAYAAGAGYAAGRSMSMVSFHKEHGRMLRRYHNAR